MGVRRGAFQGVVAAGLALVLAGCAGGADEEPAEARSPSSPSAAASPSPSPSPSESETPEWPGRPSPPPPPTWPADPTADGEPTGPLRVTDGMTEPGTRLRFGEKAVVPLRDRDSYSGEYSEGVVGVVVERIRQVPGAEITGNFDAESRELLDGSTGHYARITITNESGDDLSSVVVPRFELRTAGGGHSDVSLIGGEAEDCPESAGSPDGFDHQGATWATCQAGAASGVPLSEVHYLAPPYGEELEGFGDEPPPRFNDSYGLGAIVWS